ncbi:50S ribosomal protein L32 [Candidatus Dojkabacteria bacterium CG_4_9_14_3_um_filter_150_Dojkabacteria_WS6_41_13]|uniref:Large ribosomal subunit protein bL32 n=1 Tax=Candidatus Dojkabacteria bacterium CG_4_10_14_0_2_um_filter_Dojkabacteria_WS6_41_15 TaxID=2014249 RepID=A0A2M7W1L3_9BACT|nr:MAG: 50S ribosomal protein L32 [Candidatus Dojkabacteria bacterium CG_4_10_14_3_um_filter_Dojkabacteria_WS6_41_9]PJA13653.1 MAG: 50S ribosomal protein L32 [Candidatus Dojkabacteria bacterium CG_4_10_14_0_2_um_filter_Dojkabacteria_WS6_41_15]PJB23107.1 MAG: 50S ribosomal protein L32 [Candidatus Dojkabacteria bacterium CG_4_9_14_3_um_filter_150_Dojkabacteria_WS6_41_13]
MPATPKKRHSHARSARRNKVNSRVELEGVAICSKCGHLKKNHAKCIHCNAK